MSLISESRTIPGRRPQVPGSPVGAVDLDRRADVCSAQRLPGLTSRRAPSTGQPMRFRTSRRAGAGRFLQQRGGHQHPPLVAFLTCPIPPVLPPTPGGHLTFCKVCGGSWLHRPKTGPWSLVVSRSSWARSCCSSSGTSRKVPACAERQQEKAVTGSHQPERARGRLGPYPPHCGRRPGPQRGCRGECSPQTRCGEAGRGQGRAGGRWVEGSPRAQGYSPPLTCCLWESESWASVMGEGVGAAGDGEMADLVSEPRISNLPTHHRSHLGHWLLLFR